MSDAELAEAKYWLRRASFTGGKHLITEVRTDLLENLVGAAEERERLRTAIERHKLCCGFCSEPIGVLHREFNENLWEKLK